MSSQWRLPRIFVAGALVTGLAGAGLTAIASPAGATTLPALGELSTVAGGGSTTPTDGMPAADASFSPVNVEVDSTGNLVVADGGHFQVDVIARSTGTDFGRMMTAGKLYILAGTGALGTPTSGATASTSAVVPNYIRMDPNGNVLVSDNYGYLEVLPATTGTFYNTSMTVGHIYIVAGTGSFGTVTNGGVATSEPLGILSQAAVDANGNLVLADYGSYLIEVVAESTGTFYGRAMTSGHLYVVAGTAGSNSTAPSSGDSASSAQFGGPVGVAVDSSGNLIVDDNLFGLVEVIAENTGTYYGQSMTSGHLYIIAGAASTSPGPVSGTSATANGIDPRSAHVDGDGNVVIGDNFDEVVEVVPNTSGTYYGQSMTAGDIYIIAGVLASAQHGIGDDGEPALSANLFPVTDTSFDSAGNLYTGTSGSAGTGLVQEFGPAPATITTASLPDATAGVAYNTTLAGTGSTGPLYWEITTGTLPAGLSLDASTGAITGTPTVNTTTSFTVTGENGYYNSGAYTNGDGSGPWGNEAAILNVSLTVNAASVAAPTAPVVTIAPGNGSLTLSWPQNAAGENVTGYSYSLDNGVTWITASPTLTGSTESQTITGLTNGTTYPVEVEATNANGSTPSTAVGGVPVAPSAPTAPVVTIMPGDGSLTLSWPQNAAGESVTGYSYSLDNGVTWITASPTLTGSTESQTITGLTNGTTYPVEVEATNASGSTPSTAVGGVPVAGLAPTAPVVTITPGNGSLTLSWPQNAAGENVTGYSYSINGGSNWFPLSPTLTGSTESQTITGLTNGTTYPVKVEATNANGSTPSTQVGGTPAAGLAPTAPVVTITPGNGSLTLSWPQNAAGENVTSYSYSTDGGVTWIGASPTLTGSTESQTITGLTNGTTYPVKVKATNANGSTPSTQVGGTPAAGLAPTAPVVTITPGNGSLTLSWPQNAAGENVTSYSYSTDGGVTWIGASPTLTGSTESETITGLTNGTTYPVKVKATNANGSTPSTQVGGTPVAPAAPTAPVVTITPGNGSLTLSWPQNAAGENVTSYSYSTDGGTTWIGASPTLTGSTESQTITGLTNGTTYPVKVKATNANGSTPSTQVGGTPVAPAAPTAPVVTITPGNGSLTLSWPQNAAGENVTSYSYSTDGGVTWIGASPTLTGSTESQTITGLTNGTTYPVKVKATNANGSTPSTQVGGTPVAGLAPTAPVVTITPGNGSLTLSWPQNAAGENVTGYSYSTDGGTTWIPASPTLTGSTESQNITGLTNGTVYSVKVKATNSNGSTASNASPGTPVAGSAPTAPTVTVTPGNGSLTVSWPQNAAGENVTGYSYSTDGGTTWIPASPTLTGSTESQNITGLTNGTVYSVKVKATNSNGSTASNASPGTPVAGSAPTAPTVTVTPGNGSLTVSWPQNAAGENVTGYSYSIDGGTTWITASPTLTGSTESQTITGLTNGTAYTVKVKATNGNGSTASSAASSSPTAGPLPSAPTLSVTPGNGQLTLSWPQSPAGDNVTGYSYTLDGGTTWITAFPTLNGSTESETITGLINGNAYSIRVRATSSAGSTSSAEVSQTPAPPTTPPPTTPPPTTTPPTPTVPSTPTVPTSPPSPSTSTIPGIPTDTPTLLLSPNPAPTTVLVPTGGGAAATPQGAGYWALSSAGALSNHGNAGNFGSENSAPLNAPVVAVNSTTTGNGYWLAAADGGVFAFGDAPFVGSMGGQHLNAPVVAISSMPDNGGYRLAASDGGVFTFGTAGFHGSMGGTHLNQAITSMVSTPSGNGYWLVGADGGVFSFGDAQFFGSLGATNLNKHIVGIAATPDGLGYWLVAADGGVFTFGDAKFFGSLGATGTTPIVGIVANGNVGYRLITPSGDAIPFGTTPS